ncbi:HEAT repeat domain-containing protein [candidate division CSSED10-310 bacterium]|uniref:HEAT repeat domain-containing protein n=1 Tax=candidate division CSSED10-310 bacterium TaxID=2855610 RepID=A0ABV6Z2G4_UNCC1
MYKRPSFERFSQTWVSISDAKPGYLAQNSGPEAIPVLREIPGSYFDLKITEIAHDALLKLGGRLKNSEALISCLESENLVVCKAAILKLKEIKDNEAVPALLDFLTANKSTVTVEKIMGPDLQMISRKEMRHDRAGELDVRKSAAQALGEILGQDKAAQTIIDLYKKTNHPFFKDYIWNLIEVFGSNARPSLIQLLDRGSTSDRVHALRLLSNMGDLSLIELFEREFTSSESSVSEAAAEALASLGSPSIDILSDYLSSPKWGLRKRAIVALMKINDEKAHRLLENA